MYLPIKACGNSFAVHSSLFPILMPLTLLFKKEITQKDDSSAIPPKEEGRKKAKEQEKERRREENGFGTDDLQ